MQSLELTAEPRTDVGKGASRRLRRAGRVPGILYGSGTDVTMVSFSHDDLVTRLDYEAFFSHILTVKIGSKNESVVLKDLQRHPYKRIIIHVDFQRVRENEALTMRVPLHFMNEETCPGVKTEGGVISHVMTEVEVTCLPRDLPEYIEVDVGNLHMNETIHLGELTLPEGVTLTALEHEGDPEQPVVNVHAPRVETEEAEEEGEDEEAEEASGKAEKDEDKSGKEEDED